MKLFKVVSLLFVMQLVAPDAFATSLSVSHVIIAGHRIRVELATIDAVREHGLMHRTHMDADRGMLFVYPDAQVRVFWMKNTLIPLDILFFDAKHRLINVAANTPPCNADPCPTYPSAAPAKYVLELNAGMAQKLGIKPGGVFTTP